MIYILLAITLLCIGFDIWFYYHTKKQYNQTTTTLANVGIKLSELSEFDKLTTQNQAKTDITLINLVDVPFLFNELDPGYAKEWDGEVPYKIPSEFKGSEIKIKYFYTIDDIKDKWIKISRR